MNANDKRKAAAAIRKTAERYEQSFDMFYNAKVSPCQICANTAIAMGLGMDAYLFFRVGWTCDGLIDTIRRELPSFTSIDFNGLIKINDSGVTFDKIATQFEREADVEDGVADER